MDCSKRSAQTTVCEAKCLNPDHRFVSGSPESIVCKSRKVSPGGAKMKKSSIKCGPKSTVVSENTVAGGCGDITQAKYGITLGEGVIANCKGNACFPKCSSANQSPSLYKFSCIKKRGKFNVLPQKVVVTCSDNDSRSTLNGCGDIMAAGNKKVIKNFDNSVKVTCLERYCKLDCVNPDHVMQGTQSWANTMIRCNGKSYVPKKLQAKCVAPQAPVATPATTTQAASVAQQAPQLESEDKVVGSNPSAGFSCGNILNGIRADPSVEFSCARKGKSQKCVATCPNGGKAKFTWPDGKVVDKSDFICKGKKMATTKR